MYIITNIFLLIYFEAHEIIYNTLKHEIIINMLLKMDTCLIIHQCIQCDKNNESICIECAGNHSLDVEMNSCKCAQNAACLDDEMCVQETGQCVGKKECLSDPYCGICSRINATLCVVCLNGFEPNDVGICLEIQCSSIEYCSKCDPLNPTKCEKCSDGMILSSDNKCECLEQSGKGCATDQVCTPLRTCRNKTACFHVENCIGCDRKDPSLCRACNNGFIVAQNGSQCIPQTICGDKNCLSCAITSICDRCQINLSMSPISRKCECVKGSEKACPVGFQCSTEAKICVKQDSCLTLVPFCEQCWDHDQRKCDMCRSGYVMDLDRLTCVPNDECLSIQGCQRCVRVAPKFCEVCTGTKVGYGESCTQQNKLSTGGIIGIVVAVLIVLIGSGFGAIFLIKRKPGRTNKNPNFI